MIFGSLFKTIETEFMNMLIKNHGNIGFALFIDNHIGGTMDFWVLFSFLYKIYFPKIVWASLDLVLYKINLFYSIFNALGFIVTNEQLKFIIKHQNKIVIWPVPKYKEDMENFV